MPQVFQIFCKNKSSTSKYNVRWHTQSSLIISKFPGKFRKSCNSWRIRKNGPNCAVSALMCFARAGWLGRGMKKWNIYCRDMPRTRFHQPPPMSFLTILIEICCLYIYIYTRQKFWHVCFGDSKSTLPNSVFCWSSKLFPIHLHLLVIYVDPFPNRNYLLGAPSPT